MSGKYLLKHKEIPVLMFYLDDDYKLLDMEPPFDYNRLPYGAKYKGNEKACFTQFKDWIEKRGLPESRSDINNIKTSTGAINTKKILFGSYSLTLADHYWAHKAGLNIKWKDVNFFDNSFDSIIDFDTSFIYKNKKDVAVAPDLTVDGNLRKSWMRKDNELFLIKEGRYDEKQEPFNEVIASNIMKLFGINHVPYGLIRSEKNNIPLSICKCMVDKNTELIPAQYVLDTEQKKERNNYARFIETCANNGINNAKNKIDEMMFIDFIIANTDRHTNNFGIIRDANTLEWLRIAPIFDNGNSLFHNERNSDNIGINSYSSCRWLENFNKDNLDKIDYPQWYDASKIDSIKNIIYEGLKLNKNTDTSKIDKIINITDYNIKQFEKLINNKSNKNIRGFTAQNDKTSDDLPNDFYLQNVIKDYDASKYSNPIELAKHAGLIQGVCESVLALGDNYEMGRKLFSEMKVTKEDAKKYANPETFKKLEEGIFSRANEQKNA